MMYHTEAIVSVKSIYFSSKPIQVYMYYAPSGEEDSKGAMLPFLNREVSRMARDNAGLEPAS